MSPVLLLSFLVAALIALLPGVAPARRRLADALARDGVGAVRARDLRRGPAAGPVRLVIPIVVLAFVAPFVAGPERVDPRPPGPADRAGRGHRRHATRRPGEPEPPRHVEGEVLDDDPGPRALTGRIALHGGGEYVTGDERAMDALLAAARAAAGDGAADRRHRPDGGGPPAAGAGRRPRRAGVPGRRGARRPRDRGRTAAILTRADAAEPALVGLLAGAHLVHVPGGDPDLVPAVLRDTPAWAAILDAVDRDACLAGASAGAMALGERVWTSRGGVDGLGLLPGVAVIPHFVAGRLDAWRSIVEDGRPLAWIGIDEQTLVIGRPGETWSVAGRGRVHLVPVGAREPALVAGPGAAVPIG